MEAKIGEARIGAIPVQWKFGTETPSESTISGQGLGIIKGSCFRGPFRCDVQPSRRCYRSSEPHRRVHSSPASTFSLPNSSEHTQLHLLPCPVAGTPTPRHQHRAYFRAEEAGPWPAEPAARVGRGVSVRRTGGQAAMTPLGWERAVPGARPFRNTSLGC